MFRRILPHMELLIAGGAIKVSFTPPAPGAGAEVQFQVQRCNFRYRGAISGVEVQVQQTSEKRPRYR